MTRAGTVAGILAVGVLILAGSQGQGAETPAVPSESAGGALHTGELSRPEKMVCNAQAAPAPQDKKEPAEPAVELTLKFVPGQVASYTLTTEYYKSIEWKGPTSGKPAQFTDGRTGSHVELAFEQRVQQVQDDGNAVVQVTIKGLKYVIEAVSKVVLNFDSGRPGAARRPLAALVGQSYQVKLSPHGQVIEIVNIEPARRAIHGSTPEANAASRLLSDEEIRSRHGIAALSAWHDRFARPGQTWSNLKTFSFDDLGAKTYERIYTLKEVVGGQLTVPSSLPSAANRQLPTDSSGGRQAVVEMKAIPSAARAAQLYQQQTTPPLAAMSDNTDNYEGRLVLDLDRGQVREYAERMQNEWIIADPSSLQKGQPVAIRMAATRLHRLERLP